VPTLPPKYAKDQDATPRTAEVRLTGPRSAGFEAVIQTRTAPLDKFFAQADLPAAIAAMRPVAYENVYLFRGQRWLNAGASRRALRVSETRPRTALRIVWFAIVVRQFGRTRPGAALIARLARLRRRCLREDAVVPSVPTGE
jgi:hypothetical protein